MKEGHNEAREQRQVKERRKVNVKRRDVHFFCPLSFLFPV